MKQNHLREETLQSTEVFSGRLVKLRVDRVRLPNGRETTREVVVHRGAVTAVPLLGADRVVMVRQFRQAAGEVLLELPAGTLDPDEEPVECVRRELREEIGYFAGEVLGLFTSFLAPGYSSEMLHTFLARDLEPVGSNLEEDEFLEVVELTLDEAIGMIRTGEVRDAKTICGLLMARKVLSGE